MKIERILKNDVSMLTARSNEGKTMLLCNIIKEYEKKYNGVVWAFGMKEELVEKLKIKQFSSLIELEEIKNAIIIIDEIGIIFDLENRKKKKQIDNTLRMINHNNNKLLLTGLPTDFKKYLCGKVKCFLFKALKISDLINGSDAKEIVNQYNGIEKGAFILNIPKDKVLCYDGNFWKENVKYNKEFDTKTNNVGLFVPVIVGKKCVKKS